MRPQAVGQQSDCWLAFHAIAGSGNQKDMAVVQQAIQNRRRNDGIAAEDAAPGVEGDVGRNDDRDPGVQMVDELEEQVGDLVVHGGVAQLVNDQQIRANTASMQRAKVRDTWAAKPFTFSMVASRSKTTGASCTTATRTILTPSSS